ncbi:MAG: hypothetical protein GX915_00205 [Clostridiales bacterium]|nr:hypothetical protein [Clostridiales bacterium]
MDTEMATTIDIEGNCYVENDLSLNARKSQVRIKGEYYGYGNELAPNKSSAVIINGLKSTLDFSDLSRLLIAGRAYLDPKTSGNQYSESEQGNIQTGESLAVKGNQYTYLVPNECLWKDTSYAGVDLKMVSNPVPFDLYDKRDKQTDGLGNIPMVTLTPELQNYADGYKKIFYTNGARKEVFFFLTFPNEEKANEYLEDYYDNQLLLANSSMEARIKSFASSVTVNNSPSSMILSPGHLLTYTDASGVELRENTITADGSSVGALTLNMKNRYKALSEELSEISSGAYDVNSVYRSLVDQSKFTTGMYKEYDIEGYKAYVVDGSFNTTTGMIGIVIASGDVTVNGDYTGMIIAGGDIKLIGGANIIASSSIVNQMLNKETELNTYLRKVVVSISEGAGGSIGADRVVVSDLIGYERWKMNED